MSKRDLKNLSDEALERWYSLRDISDEELQQTERERDNEINERVRIPAFDCEGDRE